MLARRKGFALLCALALTSGAAVATNSSTAFAQGAPKGQPKGQPKGAPKGAPKGQPDAAPTGEDAKKEEAKKLYGDANEKFKANDFAGALPLFQQADAAYPGAAPKQKVAVCLDKLGKTKEAIAAYRSFIESNPGDKYADRVAEAGARIAELQAMLPAQVSLKVTPPDAKGLQVTLDGKPVQGMAFEAPAGKHTLVVTAEGFQPQTEPVDLKGSEQREVAVTLTPAKAAPPPPPAQPVPPETPPAEEGGGSNIPAYVTLGIAGAGVVLGTVFGIMALGAKGDFNDDPTNDNADKAERDALIADMSFGVALTFGITGIVLLFTGGEEAAPAAEEAAPAAAAMPQLTPYAGVHGGGLGATWRW
jgi:hypothetical protein